MKFFIALFGLFFSLTTLATPVMDTLVGTPTEYMVSVAPDDKDPNLYYFFPNHFGLAQNPTNNMKLFSYIEKCENFWCFSTPAYVNTIFEAGVSPQLTQKLAEIKKANPNAKFTPIPILSSSFFKTNVFNVLLSGVACQEQGNLLGQQLACVWKVDDSNRTTFRRAVRQNILVQVLSYGYSFIGMVRGQAMTFNQAIPVYVSDLDKGNYFLDSNGRVIGD